MPCGQRSIPNDIDPREEGEYRYIGDFFSLLRFIIIHISGILLISRVSAPPIHHCTTTTGSLVPSTTPTLRSLHPIYLIHFNSFLAFSLGSIQMYTFTQEYPVSLLFSVSRQLFLAMAHDPYSHSIHPSYPFPLLPPHPSNYPVEPFNFAPCSLSCICTYSREDSLIWKSRRA